MLEEELVLPPQHGPGAPFLLRREADGVAPTSWWQFPLVEEATKVPTLIGAIETLRAQGLTGPMVVRVFIHRWILPLRERAHPLWLH